MKAFRLVLVLVLALAAAACGGDSQIVLELTGELGEADRIEILLLEPVVLAKEQVHNATPADGAATLETVYYMAERSRTTLGRAELGDREGPPRFEIRGAGGRYVPLVMAWAGDTLLALGVYEPTRIFTAKLGVEHGPATVDAVSDVTIYPIQLEPVIRRFPATEAPQLVARGEVMEVRCGAGGPLSGYVWRLADGHELRVLVALPEGEGGEEGDRLEPADLDCDQHSPGRAQVARGDVGDQRDCDDTASAVHAGARERCSTIDEDCNSETTQALSKCTGVCVGTDVCGCDAGGGASPCLEPIGMGCELPAMTSGQGRTVCASAGEIALPPLRCQSGCEVMLAWAPEWLEVAISDAEGRTAHGLGAWATMEDAKAYLAVRGISSDLGDAPGLVMHVRAGGTTSIHSIDLRPMDGTCGASNLLLCL
jgi:hypothetical protein